MTVFLATTTTPTAKALGCWWPRCRGPVSRPFFFFQDVKDLRSGDRWMARLQQKIADSSPAIVLVGLDGIARWGGGEVEAALNRHFGPHEGAQGLMIHPVLLPGTGPGAAPPRG